MTTFTVAAPGTVLPPASKPKPSLAPLKPSRCRWYRVTSDEVWAFERLEDTGTTWTAAHLPSKTIVCDYLGSLGQCRAYVGSGEAAEDLKQIQEQAAAEQGRHE